jgi:O-antigen ligase
VAIGLIWFLYRRGFLKQRTLAITLVFAAAAVLAYQQVPVFRLDVDRTLNPDSSFLAKYDAGVLGFDEGARLTTWAHEGAKLFEAPILGRGFFNRFPGSGLWWTGSHNFWLQMLLETGIPGGLAILAIMWILWRESRRIGVLPVEVALLVAFVGGLGGEYFYGGMPLLTLVIAVSPTYLSYRGPAPPWLSWAELPYPSLYRLFGSQRPL